MRNLLRIIPLLLCIGCATFAQRIIYIDPDPTGTTPGKLCFTDTNDYPGAARDTACFKATANITTPYGFTLPPALPGATACITVTTGGVWAFDTTCAGSGGGPGGVSTDVQLNVSGAFGVVTSPNRLTSPAGTNATLNLTTVVAGGGKAVFEAKSYTGAFNSGGRFVGFAARGTVGSPTATQNQDSIVMLSGGGQGATGAGLDKVLILARAEGIWTDASNPTSVGFFTTPSGSTTLTERFTIEADGTMTVGSDGANSIAENDKRLNKVYSDTLNAEIFEIENATHTAHYSITHGASALFLNNTGGTPILELIPAGVSVLHDAGFVVPETDATGGLGTVSKRWGAIAAVDAFADEYEVNTNRAYLDADVNGGRLRLLDLAGNLVVELGVDGGDDGRLSLSDTSGVARLLADIVGLELFDSNGDRSVLVSGGDIEFRKSNTVRASVGADVGGFGRIIFEDTSSRQKYFSGVGVSSSFVTLVESGVGSGNVDLRSIGTTPDLEIDLETGGNVLPAEDNANDLGGSNQWKDLKLGGVVLIDGTQVLGPQQPAIADPTGGIVIDGPARAAIDAILDALQVHGIIDT